MHFVFSRNLHVVTNLFVMIILICLIAYLAIVIYVIGIKKYIQCYILKHFGNIFLCCRELVHHGFVCCFVIAAEIVFPIKMIDDKNLSMSNFMETNIC